jgi:hypothetical protein
MVGDAGSVGQGADEGVNVGLPDAVAVKAAREDVVD